MLAKSRRLTTRQFNEVMKKGRVSHSPLFALRVLFGQTGTRISAVAPQKIAKKAVTRNRNRRIIYAALDNLFDIIVPRVWVIIFAKKDLSEISQDILLKEIENSLINARVLSK